MEQETGAAAKGKDSNDDQNAPDPSSLTGKKEDQDQQIEKLKDESQKLKRATEDLAKLKEEKRDLEKQNEELRKRLETNECWSFGEVCRLKEISTQRSPDAAPEVEELFKRTASDEERFPTQALSASTSLDAKRRRMSEPLFHSPRMTFPTLETLHLEPTPATGCIDVSTIPVKSDKDRRPCYITGMVAISRKTLMLADESNKCIKLVNLERETVIGVKVLPSAPHDVTCVPDYSVAVTIPALHQIHVFTADQRLEQRHSMNVVGICLGIHCSGDKFFVSCKHPPLVQIMNIYGEKIRIIQLAPIEYPMYLTCSSDNKFMYVSDVYNDSVTCMDMTGSVQWRYNCKHSQSAGLTLPQGVCTGDGCIYICSFNEIHVVSPTGTKLAIIPFRMTGAKNAAVCYNSQDRTLYVSPFPSVAEENAHIIRIRMH